MRIDAIPQIELGAVHRLRVGDVLNSFIASNDYERLRFAVAYMRVSGLDRLSVSIEALINRGGSVSGAIGICDAITSADALEMLMGHSRTSTIFHTVSGYIYHPKFYLLDGHDAAVAVIGSPNLTRDGLFRNVELAVAIHFDLRVRPDLESYRVFEEFMSELLNPANPNVQVLDNPLVNRLVAASAIRRESETSEPGPAVVRGRRSRQASPLLGLFPPLYIPAAPPAAGKILSTLPRRAVPARRGGAVPVGAVPAGPAVPAGMFLMQLSPFDSSHRSGVKGTPEVLIPHGAIGFFPSLTMGGRKYPDAFFNIILNTPTGGEIHQYRLWYYEERAVGTRIDEYRLRMDRDTIDLSAVAGGDLLVISRLPGVSDPAYDVTILPQTDPTYATYLVRCNRVTQGKRWGLE
jgi:hypothetical protein